MEKRKHAILQALNKWAYEWNRTTKMKHSKCRKYQIEAVRKKRSNFSSLMEENQGMDQDYLKDYNFNT